MNLKEFNENYEINHFYSYLVAIYTGFINYPVAITKLLSEKFDNLILWNEIIIHLPSLPVSFIKVLSC